MKHIVLHMHLHGVQGMNTQYPAVCRLW